MNDFNNQIVLFGFCPGADFSRRLVTRWKELGIYEFYYTDSPMQVKRFATIEVGDLIVLKKRQVISRTTRNDFLEDNSVFDIEGEGWDLIYAHK